MILRLSSPAARILLALPGSMLATAVSDSGIRNALAVDGAELHTPDDATSRLAPDATSRLAPDATNRYFLGRHWLYHLEDPDARRAIRGYQTALCFDAYSGDSRLHPARAYESEGDSAAARNAFLQAKRGYRLLSLVPQSAENTEQ
jgi:hypothetical protein